MERNNVTKLHRWKSNNPSFASWAHRMRTALTKPLYDKHVAKLLIQKGWGPTLENLTPRPRSLYDPDKLFEGLHKFSEDRSLRVCSDDVFFQHGIRVAYSLYAKPEEAEYFDLADPFGGDLTKSAGLPTLLKKRDVDHMEVLDRMDAIILKGAAPQPCLAQKRTQAHGKTRLVWGYPFEMTAFERQYAQPLIEYFGHVDTPIATGASKLNLSTRILHSSRKGFDSIALDFSGYDTSVPKDLIQVAFNIIRTWYKERYWDEISLCENYFIHTPIVMPDEYLYVKHRGVPSGSNFTQLIDSIINTIIQFALSARFQLHLQAEDLYILGDDVLMFIRERHCTKKKVQAFDRWLSTFGFKINVKKTHVGKKHFLGATWIDGLRYRELEDVLCNLLYPESFRHYTPGNEVAEAAEVIKATTVDSMVGSTIWRGKGVHQPYPVNIEYIFAYTDAHVRALDGYARYLHWQKMQQIDKLRNKGITYKSSVSASYLS